MREQRAMMVMKKSWCNLTMDTGERRSPPTGPDWVEKRSHQAVGRVRCSPRRNRMSERAGAMAISLGLVLSLVSPREMSLYAPY
jgi:hypothetical protein